jgi:hypothetical protein
MRMCKGEGEGDVRDEEDILGSLGILGKGEGGGKCWIYIKKTSRPFTVTYI